MTETTAMPLPQVSIKAERPKQNGQTRPEAGSRTGLVWDYADYLMAQNMADNAEHRVPLVGEVKELYMKIDGAQVATCQTQYGRWVTFHGLQEEVKAKRDALKGQMTEEQRAAKEEKERVKAEKAAAREERTRLREAAKEEREAAKERKAAEKAEKAELKKAADQEKIKKAAEKAEETLRKAQEKAEAARASMAEAEAAAQAIAARAAEGTEADEASEDEEVDLAALAAAAAAADENAA